MDNNTSSANDFHRPRLTTQEYGVVKKLEEIPGSFEQLDQLLNMGWRPEASERQRARNHEKLKAKAQALQKQVNEAEQRIHDLEALDTVQTTLRASLDRKPIRLARQKSTGRNSQGTAIIQLSDWHVGATIKPAELNGLNAYNIEIARARLFDHFLPNLLYWIQYSREALNLRQILVLAQGDLIDGWLHDDQAPSQSVTPLEAGRLVQDWLYQIIVTIRNETGLPVYVDCVDGNHGRNTKKRFNVNRAQNSIEYSVYCNLARELEREGITCHTTEATETYIQVYRWVLRSTHGDNINVGNAQGGPIPSIIRGTDRINRRRHADYTLIGHFHQFGSAGPNIGINGCTVGYNQYAQAMGFPFQRPIQALRFIHEEHGYTTPAIPIFCNQEASPSTDLYNLPA